MMNKNGILTGVKDWLWDKLFLDFYLDNGWTLEFKILNFISRDFLRDVVTELHYRLSDENCPEPCSIHIRRAKYWANAAWNVWRK